MIVPVKTRPLVDKKPEAVPFPPPPGFSMCMPSRGQIHTHHVWSLMKPYACKRCGRTPDQ